MRDWIDAFEKRKTNIGFQAAKLAESTAELSNPARGWYQIHTFLAEQEPDFEELRWCLHPKDTLAFLLIDIGTGIWIRRFWTGFAGSLNFFRRDPMTVL